jgi:hypothetical protein
VPPIVDVVFSKNVALQTLLRHTISNNGLSIRVEL